MYRTPLIIPVENQVRELDAKLLLACVAAERGFPVVIGSRTFVNFSVPFVPRGIFLAKSLRAISSLMLGFTRDLGHDIVAWDEESLVRFQSPEYVHWRYSAATFATVSRLFAWGPDDAEFFAAYTGNNALPVHVTGNPRMDLLRPELRGYFGAEADALREAHGRFILVNTNFPFVNAFVPGLNLLQPGPDGDGEQVGRTGRGLSLAFARRMAAHIQALHDSFRNTIPLLSEWFPGHRIIIRPHPSEDHDSWRRSFAGLPNVRVLHEGNVIPWLMASEVLLHNGCTTAVEAAVLEKPAVTWQPVTSEEFDYHLPNRLSHRAFTLAELREQLAAVLDGQSGLVAAAERQRILARHLASTEGPLAADRVMDVLLEAGYPSRSPAAPPPGRRARAWLGANGRTLLKRVNMLRPNHRNSAAYHAHRFPEISVGELRARVRRLGELLGRFDNLRIERSSRFLFRVLPGGQAS